MNGFKLCAQIREAESWVPIMVLTAKTGDLDQAESLDAGADDFLTKPFALAVFVAHVRALLRRTSHIQVRRLTVNGLVSRPGSASVLEFDRRGPAMARESRSSPAS